jgi:hypothetical protein
LAQRLSIPIILASFFISNEERDTVKKLTRRVTAVTAITAASVLFVGVGMARAATFPGTYTAFPDPAQGDTYNIVGSETMQDVLGGITQGYSLGSFAFAGSAPSNGPIGSWNAVNPSTGATYDSITPVSGGDSFPRPNGSGDGRNAVSAANNSSDSCFTESGVTGHTCLTHTADFQQELSVSRASALPSESLWSSDNPTGGNSGVPDQLTWFPVAKDAVGIAEEKVGSTSSQTVPNFYTGALTAIYTGGTYQHTAGANTVGDVFETSIGGVNYPFVVTGVSLTGAISSSEQVIPVLPQSSSGTRSFFLSAINASTFNAATVANETGAAAQEENNGADLLTANINKALGSLYSVNTSVPELAIVCFSGGQLIEQNHGFVTNTTTALTFPTINNATLWNDKTGASAAPGTLQNGTPVITFGASVVGNFDRYLWVGIPTSEVSTGGPTTEAPLQKWLDQTIPNLTDTGGSGSPWGDFGFVPVTVSDTTSDWVHTEYTNNGQ